jgi:hypothetical protein
MLALSKSATVFVNYLATQYVPLTIYRSNLSPLSYISTLPQFVSFQVIFLPHEGGESDRRDKHFNFERRRKINTLPPSSANEYAQSANRKTIAPADVFKALEEIEFDYKDRLEAELASMPFSLSFSPPITFLHLLSRSLSGLHFPLSLSPLPKSFDRSHITD